MLCPHCQRRRLANAVTLYRIEWDPGSSGAELVKEQPLGCRTCLVLELLRGFGSCIQAVWRCPEGVSRAGLPAAAARNLIWSLRIPFAGPTAPLREALLSAGIPYRDFLAGVELGSRAPDLSLEERIGQARALVTLLRAVAIAFGARDDRQWRSLRHYVRFLFDSEPEVLRAADPGDQAPDPPTIQEVTDACAILRRGMSLDDLTLTLHLMIGVTEVGGKVLAPVRDRLFDIAIQFGLDAATVAEILEAVSVQKPESEPEPEPPPIHEQFESNDPWVVFGLKRTASRTEIRARYLKLVLEHHPDRHAHLGEAFQKAANLRLVKINTAYRRLQAACRRETA
ncbi:MAG: J domain-containing protein [Planctomycetota bacterium]